MASTPTVSPEEVHDRLQRGDDTLLVCAYDDDEKCKAKHLDGSIPLSELQQRDPSEDRKLVFYCA